MGYKIYYGNKNKYPTIEKKRKSTLKIVISIICITGILTICRKQIKRVIVPDNDTAAQKAYALFKSELESGTPFQAALEVLCREIIYGET